MSKFLFSVAALFLVLPLTAHGANEAARSFPDGGKVVDEVFGKYEHKAVLLHTLSNSNGMSVSIMDYGATIVRIVTPDREGKAGIAKFAFTSGLVLHLVCAQHGRSLNGVQVPFVKTEHEQK